MHPAIGYQLAAERHRQDQRDAPTRAASRARRTRTPRRGHRARGLLAVVADGARDGADAGASALYPGDGPARQVAFSLRRLVEPTRPAGPLRAGLARSEEHTSELQSRENLVCRLLLEKKK